MILLCAAGCPRSTLLVRFWGAERTEVIAVLHAGNLEFAVAITVGFWCSYIGKLILRLGRRLCEGCSTARRREAIVWPTRISSSESARTVSVAMDFQWIPGNPSCL